MLIDASAVVLQEISQKASDYVKSLPPESQGFVVFTTVEPGAFSHIMLHYDSCKDPFFLDGCRMPRSLRETLSRVPELMGDGIEVRSVVVTTFRRLDSVWRVRVASGDGAGRWWPAPARDHELAREVCPL